MKEYELKEQNNDWYEVKGHSCISRIRLACRDTNAGDAWANIVALRTVCSIVLKGQKEPLIFSHDGRRVAISFDYKKHHVNATIDAYNGVLSALRALEIPTVRVKKDKKRKLAQIDADIKALREERKALKKDTVHQLSLMGGRLY